MLISAAIIVKDEASIISRCLECVSLFADEIVIVDTGSTDGTQEIAQKHSKVRLYQSEFFDSSTRIQEFSFSVARNEAIKRCNGEWVCWFDADDFIDEENANKIRGLAFETKETCLFSFVIKFGPIEFKHCRLFRNNVGILFDEGHSCHEYLNVMGFPNHQKDDIFISHLPIRKHVSSGERNIAIMETDHYNRGMNDPRTLFYLANSYREVQRNEDSVTFYDKYLAVSQWNEERFFARYFKAQVLCLLGQWDDARSEAFRALSEDARFAEAYCLLGDLSFRDGDMKKATNWFSMALCTEYPKSSKLFITRALYEEYPAGRIADCGSGSLENSFESGVRRFSDNKLLPTKEIMGNFFLPSERDELLDAAATLAVLGESHDKVFELAGTHKDVRRLVESCEWFVESFSGDVQSLSLPKALLDRSRMEWYSRTVGHVPADWSLFIKSAEKYRETFERCLDAS